MDYSAEERFVNRYIRKNRRERILHELATPAKRHEGLSRFCHQSEELLDSARILMKGEDLERSAAFLEFARKHDGICYVLSPDYSPEGQEMPLNDAVDWAVSCFDAVVIIGKDFALVFGEVMKGGRGKYLLA